MTATTTMAEKPPDLTGVWIAVSAAVGGALTALFGWLKAKGQQDAAGAQGIMEAFTDERRRTDDAIARLSKETDERIKALATELEAEKAVTKQQAEIIGQQAQTIESQAAMNLAQSNTIATTNLQMKEVLRENRELRHEVREVRRELEQMKRAAHIEVEISHDGPGSSP
jgi:hypothetical protein